jgi:Protein of unknown function (DUF3644)
MDVDRRAATPPFSIFPGRVYVVKAKRGSSLEKWEISLIKAMLERSIYNDQDILAYFTRPTRSVNHRVIGEIRTEAKHKSVKIATSRELEEFLSTWPDVDPQTGLSLRGDELLIKAREAMIAAVHIFNGAGLTFRTELFIVTCIIAWTYLLHAWCRREGIDYRHHGLTKQGAERYWELEKCLRHPKCPIPIGAIKNLEFLIELRHEIEHRSTNRIDDAVSSKLQACCINFNDALKKLFGAQYGLEKCLPIALQFLTFDSDQRAILKKASTLPPNIEAMMDAFHSGLTDEEQADPNFAYRVIFVPKLGSRASNSDLAIEFVKPDTDEAREINRIYIKEVDKRRYTATQIVEIMHSEGYVLFKSNHHSNLWKELDAKAMIKGFGRPGDYKNSWVWYDSWLARVRAHCQEHAAEYRW